MFVLCTACPRTQLCCRGDPVPGLGTRSRWHCQECLHRAKQLGSRSLCHPCAIPVPSLLHPCCGLAGWASMAVQEWVWIAECCARTWCRNVLLIPLHSQVVPREFQVGYQEKFPLKHWHRAVWSHHPGSVQKPVKVALHTMAQWNLDKDWTQSWRSFPAFMILWFSAS